MEAFTVKSKWNLSGKFQLYRYKMWGSKNKVGDSLYKENEDKVRVDKKWEALTTQTKCILSAPFPLCTQKENKNDKFDWKKINGTHSLYRQKEYKVELFDCTDKNKIQMSSFHSTDRMNDGILWLCRQNEIKQCSPLLLAICF